MQDLRGKTVASEFWHDNMRQLVVINANQQLGMNVIAGRIGRSFLLLETDRAAALVMDDILLSSLSAKSKQPDAYHIVDDPFRQRYAIMIRRDDPQFKTIVDRVMVELMQNGEVECALQKWFTKPHSATKCTLG